ncbi:MAG: hypothetical protein JWS10_4169 [Cypionkella sp.]|nr:hypothetical protein [Cypionkella sp.]
MATLSEQTQHIIRDGLAIRASTNCASGTEAIYRPQLDQFRLDSATDTSITGATSAACGTVALSYRSEDRCEKQYFEMRHDKERPSDQICEPLDTA